MQLAHRRLALRGSGPEWGSRFHRLCEFLSIHISICTLHHPFHAHYIWLHMSTHVGDDAPWQQAVPVPEPLHRRRHDSFPSASNAAKCGYTNIVLAHVRSRRLTIAPVRVNMCNMYNAADANWVQCSTWRMAAVKNIEEIRTDSHDNHPPCPPPPVSAWCLRRCLHTWTLCVHRGTTMHAAGRFL